MEDFTFPLNQDCEDVFAVQCDLLKRREFVSPVYVEAVWLDKLLVSISLKNPTSVTEPVFIPFGRPDREVGELILQACIPITLNELG